MLLDLSDMSSVMHVKDLIEQVQAGQVAFLARFTHPFLIVVESPETKDAQGDEFYTTQQSSVDVKRLIDIASGRRLDPDAIVYPVVKKSDRNSRSGIVTIGRTANCDIVLPFSKISKLHCYITSNPLNPDTYCLADSGSSNGTKINDSLVAANKIVDLPGGATITIAKNMVMRFLLAQEIWEMLRQE